MKNVGMKLVALFIIILYNYIKKEGKSMQINRDYYLKKMIKKDGNGLIKVITGIRRCGKSYLLGTIFYDYLVTSGIDNNHIIYMPLDIKENKKYLDGDVFLDYIKGKIIDNNKYYLLIDEVQLMSDFVSVLNSFLYMKNVEVYVTGSNAKLLSRDISTEFRGRGDEIHVYPLSFSEYMSVYDGTKYEGWDSYFMYGGLPLILSFDDDREKAEYLKKLFDETYTNDIVERNNISSIEELNDLINVLASSIGSLTNPSKLENTFKSELNKNLTDKTISNYISYLEDAFLINKAKRFDIKGKKYIGSPYKYYFEDVGLRNARLNFRQLDNGHITENIVYNELIRRGYNVDVGIVEVNKINVNGTSVRPQYEVDFVANLGSNKYYIQVAYQIDNNEKYIQETNSLTNINDSFKKIIIVKDDIKPRWDEFGIMTIGIYNFLLDENSLNL
jgi:hypothetical protein